LDKVDGNDVVLILIVVYHIFYDIIYNYILINVVIANLIVVLVVVFWYLIILIWYILGVQILDIFIEVHLGAILVLIELEQVQLISGIFLEFGWVCYDIAAFLESFSLNQINFKLNTAVSIVVKSLRLLFLNDFHDLAQAFPWTMLDLFRKFNLLCKWHVALNVTFEVVIVFIVFLVAFVQRVLLILFFNIIDIFIFIVLI